MVVCDLLLTCCKQIDNNADVDADVNDDDDDDDDADVDADDDNNDDYSWVRNRRRYNKEVD